MEQEEVKEINYLEEGKRYLISSLEENNFQIFKGLKFFLGVSSFVYMSLFFYYKEDFLLFYYFIPFSFLFLFNYAFLFFNKKDQKKSVDILLTLNGIFLFFHFLAFSLSDIYFYYTLSSLFFIITCILGYLFRNTIIFTLIFILMIGSIAYMTSEIGFKYKYKTGDLKFNHSYPVLFSIYFILSYVSFLFWIVYDISKTLYGVLEQMPTVLTMFQNALFSKRESEDEAMIFKSQLNLASKLQNMVLPHVLEEEQVSNRFLVDIAGRMDPAAEVGGDYYDILTRGDDLYLGIGDVTDHGLESGLVMLMCQSSYKNSLYRKNIDIKHALSKANKAVYEIGTERMDTGRTMSLSFAKYKKDGRLLLTGQHEKLIICRQGKKIEWIETGELGFIIGITDEIEDYVSEQSIQLEIGDSALFYTDGANEAENEKKEQMGEEAVSELFLKYNSFPTKKMLDLIYKDIYKFIGKQVIFDDITMLCLKRI